MQVPRPDLMAFTVYQLYRGLDDVTVTEVEIDAVEYSFRSVDDHTTYVEFWADPDGERERVDSFDTNTVIRIERT